MLYTADRKLRLKTSTVHETACVYLKSIGMPVILFSCPITFSLLNFCLIFSMVLIS